MHTDHDDYDRARQQHEERMQDQARQRWEQEQREIEESLYRASLEKEPADELEEPYDYPNL